MKTAMRISIVLAVLAAAGLAAQAQDADAPPAPAPTMDGKSYLLSSEPLFPDTEILWPGFLTGMKATTDVQEKFIDPLGNPIYFESPFIETNLDLIYLWHDFASSSQVGGGQVNVLAAQARVALTDRIAFIATKDGYSWLETGITPDGDGWNDAAIGFKWAFFVGEGCDCVATTGIRWEWYNGDREILQGGSSGHQELSPFISVAKGYDRLHLLGNLTWRAPFDSDLGNHIVQWDLHADYEIAPETLPGFFPLLEVHGMHYLTEGEYLPLDVGGLDYSNFGSSEVGGDFVCWGDIGFRWELTPNVSFGCGYGFPITDPSDDLMNQRLTARLTLSY